MHQDLGFGAERTSSVRGVPTARASRLPQLGVGFFTSTAAPLHEYATYHHEKPRSVVKSSHRALALRHAVLARSFARGQSVMRAAFPQVWSS
jgi:hypothetical protein